MLKSLILATLIILTLAMNPGSMLRSNARTDTDAANYGKPDSDSHACNQGDPEGDLHPSTNASADARQYFDSRAENKWLPSQYSCFRPKQDLAPDVRLTPLQLLDSHSFRSALSEAELSCISDDPGEQARLLDGSRTASPGEYHRFLGCLQDGTMARVFLAGLIPGPEPLSPDTSTCVRAVLEVINPRDVITAQIEGDLDKKEATTSRFVTMSETIACLNDGEWEKAAPRTVIRANDRTTMQCVMRALGGSGPLTVAMQAKL